MRGFGARAVLPGLAGACIRGGLLRPGAIGPQGGQRQGEGSIGLVPQRLVQRDAAHHGAAEVRTDDIDGAGLAEPAGSAVAGLRDMGAERQGEMLAVIGESEDQGDKDGKGVKSCGSAGPSPR